ncbi:MAG: hypothetical protein WD276_08695 [Actinomycetota bacterium]
MGNDESSAADEITALEERRAYADQSSLRKSLVAGADSTSWLNDIVTAGVDELTEGMSIGSLLLTPTGHVRAHFQVVRMKEDLLLLQDRRQPEAVADLLSPYVLSSDVRVEDRSEALAVFSLPGKDTGPGSLPVWRPSILGEGVDVIVESDAKDAAASELRAALIQASEQAIEAWRIRRGVPRFPIDFGTDALPAEAGLESAIDFEKGCFLGQESVAKVRNLGHPPRVLLALRARERVEAGDSIMAVGDEAGTVTSAAGDGAGGTALIARIRWGARDEPLSTAAGTPLAAATPVS